MSLVSLEERTTTAGQEWAFHGDLVTAQAQQAGQGKQ